MKQSMLLILILIIILISHQCDTTEPPQSKATLTLELEDVSCTEAWIKLTTTNLPLPTSITLKQNDTARATINLTTSDTLLYVDSLLPKQTYTYQVSSIQSTSGGQVSSNKANATTMDTTSHNFTWQTWTFGEHSNSVLYDVAIINENNIWAVGEIYMKDSLGRPDPNCYNAMHWNGQRWELIKTGGYGGYPRRTVFAFSENDIWFDGVIHWDGSKYTVKNNGWPLMPNGDGWLVNKMWGISSNDLYAVGNNGNIAHWDGVKWSKIESGTTLNINDIWGGYDEKTEKREIIAVASNYGIDDKKEILLIKKDNIQKLSTDANPQMEPLLTIWFVPNRKYYVAGSGIYQKHLLSDSYWKHKLYSITTFATTSIRGNGVNDVIGVGAFGDLVHFNGLNWKNDYQEPMLSNGSYTEVAIKGNLVVAVGGNSESINSKAVILFGRR